MQPSDDSPWWLFRQLEKSTRRGLDFDEETVEAIKGEWAPVQSDLIESAYKIASEGSRLVQKGQSAKAVELTTGYMDSNAALVLEKIREILSRTAPMAVGASS